LWETYSLKTLLDLPSNGGFLALHLFQLEL
jgi:hypothetical protein